MILSLLACVSINCVTAEGGWWVLYAFTRLIQHISNRHVLYAEYRHILKASNIFYNTLL